jgi:hypothetical protein
MTLRAALLALLLGAFPVLAHKGDGSFTDHGAGGASNRFELDLGSVDLERAQSREFRFAELPAGEFTFGLRLTAAGGGRPGALPSATVRMALVNERDEVIFDVTDELANWLRSESSKEMFLYLRGMQKYPAAPQGRAADARLAIGPDGGWGTYASIRAQGRYRLTFETVKADSRLAKLAVHLVAVGSTRKE